VFLRELPAVRGACLMLLPGHVLGAAAGLCETDRLRDVLDDRHRWHGVRRYLHELGGDLPGAVAAYAEAAGRATNVAEREHLVLRPPARGPRRCGASPKPLVLVPTAEPAPGRGTNHLAREGGSTPSLTKRQLFPGDPRSEVQDPTEAVHDR
jgi:hypothetical protein